MISFRKIAGKKTTENFNLDTNAANLDATASNLDFDIDSTKTNMWLLRIE